MDLDKTNKREIAQEKTEETETNPFIHSGVSDSFHFISQEIRKSGTFHNTLHFKKSKDLATFFTLLSGIKEFSLFDSAYIYKINFHCLELLSPYKREERISINEWRFFFSLTLGDFQCLFHHTVFYYIKISFFGVMK